MSGFVGAGRVLAHNVVIHKSFSSEEREATRTTQDAANHMFGSLLEPMADSVFEELVPHHRAGSDGMNASASGAQVTVLFHQIDQELYSVGQKVNVSVKGEQVRVLGNNFLTIDRDRQLHKFVSQKVVHVHDLTPSLPVTDFALVLQVSNHLGLAG
jgi:hypothetical protein